MRFVLLMLLITLPLRASQPVEYPLPVAIAHADVVAVVVPFAIDDNRAECIVERVLKGPPLKTQTVSSPFWLRGFYELEKGKRSIVFLRENGERLFNGTGDWSETGEAEIRALLPKIPPWTRQRDGVAVIAVPEKFSIARDESLQVWFGWRNDSTKAAAFRWRDWPVAEQTWWSLDVRHESGTPVEPQPHLPQETIEKDYASMGAHAGTQPIAAGSWMFMFIDRINTAVPGWGHKERLGFRYYPMTAPGRYTIVATAHRFRDFDERAAPFVVDVR